MQNCLHRWNYFCSQGIIFPPKLGPCDWTVQSWCSLKDTLIFPYCSSWILLENEQAQFWFKLAYCVLLFWKILGSVLSSVGENKINLGLSLVQGSQMSSSFHLGSTRDLVALVRVDVVLSCTGPVQPPGPHAVLSISLQLGQVVHTAAPTGSRAQGSSSGGLTQGSVPCTEERKEENNSLNSPLTLRPSLT